jgi:DNA-binding transcriptional ArsR family regulator
MNSFDALANPLRRAILLELPRSPIPVGVLAERFSVSRPALGGPRNEGKPGIG